MPRVAAYLRVSTTAQDWATQTATIRRAAEARGEAKAIRWFREKGSAARSLPVLGELRAAARRGEIRKLFVYAYDRLSRSGIVDTLTVVRELYAHGCEVVSMIDGFDVAGPGGELALAVMAWSAEQERKRLLERMRDARARVEKSGGRWGRPRALDPQTIAQARKLLKPGTSIRAVAERLEVSRATLQRALVGEGHYVAQKGLAKQPAKSGKK